MNWVFFREKKFFSSSKKWFVKQLWNVFDTLLLLFWAKGRFRSYSFSWMWRLRITTFFLFFCLRIWFSHFANQPWRLMTVADIRRDLTKFFLIFILPKFSECRTVRTIETLPILINGKRLIIHGIHTWFFNSGSRANLFRWTMLPFYLIFYPHCKLLQRILSCNCVNYTYSRFMQLWLIFILQEICPIW